MGLASREPQGSINKKSNKTVAQGRRAASPASQGPCLVLKQPGPSAAGSGRAWLHPGKPRRESGEERGFLPKKHDVRSCSLISWFPQTLMTASCVHKVRRGTSFCRGGKGSRFGLRVGAEFKATASRAVRGNRSLPEKGGHGADL